MAVFPRVENISRIPARSAYAEGGGISMATTAHAVSVEEYLRTSYEHDPEYIDGEIRERPMPTRLHAFVQLLLGLWFGQRMEEWSILPYSEVRTRVRPSNFRLPDMAVARKAPINTRTLDEAPLIAIEILSDDDRAADLRKRAVDFAAMGTENVWLLDPETRQAYRWVPKDAGRGDWFPVETLEAEGTPVHLDLAWLWQKVEQAQ